MMSMKITGIDDVKHILEDIAPKRATNLITATVRGVATEVQKEAKKNGKARFNSRSGSLLKSMKVKKSRSDKFKPIFKVVFESGKDKKHDGFYWRFLEHGTKSGLKATNFVRDARLAIESDLDRYLTVQFSKKLQSALKKELKRQAKK